MQGIGLDLAQNLAKQAVEGLVSNEITVTDLDSFIAVVQGLTPAHNQSYQDDEGEWVNRPSISPTFVEKTLVDAGFTVRDSNNAVAMQGWRVQFTLKDDVFDLKIKETMPDSAHGTIITMAGMYNENETIL